MIAEKYFQYQGHITSAIESADVAHRMYVCVCVCCWLYGAGGGGGNEAIIDDACVDEWVVKAGQQCDAK